MTQFRIALFIRIIGILSSVSLLFFSFFVGFSDAQTSNAQKMRVERRIEPGKNGGNLPEENAPPVPIARLSFAPQNAANDAAENAPINNDKLGADVSININDKTPSEDGSEPPLENADVDDSNDEVRKDASETPSLLPLGRRANERADSAFAPATTRSRFADKENENAPTAVVPVPDELDALDAAQPTATKNDATNVENGANLPTVVRRNIFSNGLAFYELSNGLQLLLKPTNERRGVVRLFCPEGGVLGEREYAGTGIARLTAELIGDGATPTRSPAFSRAELNAWGASAIWETNAEGALFSLDVGAENLAAAIDRALDVAFRSTFDETRFQRAVRAAKNRIDAANRDREKFVEARTAETVYRESPLREPNDGRPKLLEILTLADVRDFYATRYAPNKLIFAVAGPIDPDATADAIRNACRETRRVAALYSGEIATEPRQVSRRETTAEFPGTNAELILVWSTVEADAPDAPVFDAIAAVLTGGLNARLTRRAADGSLPALEIAASATSPTRGGRGTFQLRATVAPENLELVERELLAEIKRLRTVVVSETESNAAQKRLATSFRVRNANPAIALETSARALAATGDPTFWNRYFESAARVDSATIQRVAAERLGDVYSRIAIVPEGAAPRATGSIANPPPTRIVGTPLSNGSQIFRLVSPDAELVDVRIVAAAGSLVETRETAGYTELIGELLDKGSANFSRADVANYFDSIGATFEIEVGRHTISLGATVLKEDFEKTFEILLDAATRPTFDDAEFRRAQERTLAKRRDVLGRPDGALFALFFDSVPSESTYSIPPFGTRESLEKATPDDLYRFRRAIFAPQNVVVGVSGAFDETAATAAVRRLGAIARDPTFRPINFDRRSVPMQAIARARLVQTTTEGNALLAVAIPSVAERDEIAALTVLQTVWQGANGDGTLDRQFVDFDGAVRKRVDLSVGPTPGYMTIWLTAAPDALPDAKRRAEAAVAESIKSLISKEMCVVAKRQILSRLGGRYISSKDKLRQAILDEIYRLEPKNEPERREELFRGAIERTTPEDVRRVAQKYWGTESTVFDVVSPKSFPGVPVNFDEKTSLDEESSDQ